MKLALKVETERGSVIEVDKDGVSANMNDGGRTLFEFKAAWDEILGFLRGVAHVVAPPMTKEDYRDIGGLFRSGTKETHEEPRSFDN